MDTKVGLFLNLDGDYTDPEHVCELLPDILDDIEEGLSDDDSADAVELYVEFRRGESFTDDRTELRRFLVYGLDGMYSHLHIPSPDMLSSEPLEVLHVYNYMHEVMMKQPPLFEAIGGDYSICSLPKLREENSKDFIERNIERSPGSLNRTNLGDIDGVDFRLVSGEPIPDSHERIIEDASDSTAFKNLEDILPEE